MLRGAVRRRLLLGSAQNEMERAPLPGSPFPSANGFQATVGGSRSPDSTGRWVPAYTWTGQVREREWCRTPAKTRGPVVPCADGNTGPLRTRDPLRTVQQKQLAHSGRP